MIRLKTRRNFLQTREASQQQSRPDKQQHGQGYFRSDQQAANPVMSGAGGRTPRALIQSFAKIEFCGSQSRNQPKKQSGEHRHSKREQENRAVQFNRDDLSKAV